MSVGVVDVSATEAAAAEETVANPRNVRGDFREEPPSFGDDATFGAPEGDRGDAVVFASRRIGFRDSKSPLIQRASGDGEDAKAGEFFEEDVTGGTGVSVAAASFASANE